MQNNSLLFGIGGFILGGLVVAIAATTFDKPNEQTSNQTMPHSSITALASKQGDAYDKAFLADMIVHHEGALDMAKLSDTQAKHQEIKTLSQDIQVAQKKEIAQMKQWQKQWGYDSAKSENDMPGMSH